MSGIQDFVAFEDDFIGASAAFPSAADPATPWVITDTSAAGTPTYVRNASNAVLTLAATSEIENVCLSHGDALSFNIDLLQSIEFRVKLGAAFTAGSELVVGIGSGRNDTTDSIVANAWFKLVGTGKLVVETDDDVRNVDDVATNIGLGTDHKKFVIDFTGGKGNVRFYIDGVRVASGTKFDMSGYSSGLQPIVQLQKAANTNVDSVSIDYVRIEAKRW